MPVAATIRPVTPQDDLALLTKVIHAAYAKHSANNLRYWATHQTVEDTAERFSSGQGFVAERDGQVVGTLTVRPPKPDSEVPLYRNSATWTLCQFAVLPAFQGFSIGRRLHDAALEYASFNGGRVVALDTAAPATDLVDLYLRWGYTVVGECDWRLHTNYLSIVMSRPIAGPVIQNHVR